MAKLILEDGTVFEGRAFGAKESCSGEVGKYLGLHVLSDLMWLCGNFEKKSTE